MTPVLFRSVFVPLDGSPFAEQALSFAVEIARRAGAMLQLGMVHHPVPALATALEVPEIEAQLDQEARAREKTYLESIVNRVRGSANVPVTSTLVEGAVADALQSQIESSGADLVVLTTHGRGAVSRFWLGSVADQLMRRLHVPLLMVRPTKEAPPPPQIRRILIALDGSPFAERALAWAMALGKPFGASYTLLFVVEPPLPIADPSGLMVLPATLEAERKLKENAQAYVTRAAEKLRQEGLDVSTTVADSLTAANAILAHATETKADVIALASHGAGGFERLVLGSVADKVIRGATEPVLVVRPPRDIL
jgi:nucleotide-binding universal stress UspA family protein